MLKIQAERKPAFFKWFNRNKSSFESLFVKTICLSKDMDRDQISAKFKNGRLTIIIPKKKEHAGYREIPVSGISAKHETGAFEEQQNIFTSLKHKLKVFFGKPFN